MIQLNSQQKLSGAAFGYMLFGAAVMGIVLIALGLFVFTLGHIQGSTTVNGVTTQSAIPSFWPGIALILIGLILPIYRLLWASMFSFVIADRSVTINSGVVIRQSKTIDYARVQNVDNVRGPLQALFGITQVNIWTASQDQFQTHTTYVNGIPRTTTTVRPEGRLYLLKEDAEQVRSLISNKGAVQDVNIVSSQIAPQTPQVPPQVPPPLPPITPSV